MLLKIVKAFLPSIIGLLMVFAISQARQSMIEHFYPDEDAVLSFQPLLDFEIFAITFFPILIIVVVFQFIVVLPTWKKYLAGQRLFRLNYIQLLLTSCVIFGIVCAIATWKTYMPFVNLIFRTVYAAGCAAAYWIHNLLVLTLLQKKQYSS